ncbi:MAG TPA: hypothetical protein PLX23_07045 [Candidatus Hydrogenedens sp.]|nr:hypothetical protein [Candidatus Hydrogenedens sp.]
MSSILEALKKLEEEKQRQLKLLEKEEEQDFSEPISISTIAKPDTPVPVHDTASNFLTPKFLFIGLALFIVILSVISVSVSFLVVKTQVTKNVQNTVATEIPTSESKTETPVIVYAEKPLEESAKESISKSEIIESTTPPHTTNSTSMNNNNQENIVTPSQTTKSDSNQPSSIEKEIPKVQENKIETSTPIEQKQSIIEDNALQIAKNTPSGKTTPVPEEVNKEISLSQQEETIPQPAVKPFTTNTETTQTENTKNAIPSPESPAEEHPQPTPTIITKELEPPSSLKPEQFQKTLSLSSKVETEAPIDMTKLPVLKTSDRVRLGLDTMQLNVLREAGPKNPHGLAIINLTKVYVGEMIPGTSVRLLDVKTYGIAIEVVGSGERYYVPR